VAHAVEAPEVIASIRVALVTGAASGLGAALSNLLVSMGWRVAGLDLRPSNTDLSLTADVANPEAVAGGGRVRDRGVRHPLRWRELRRINATGLPSRAPHDRR
jgi:NAD(P)-dependent dehydrogenase (short-subunit alcohol dehydrogenase family)